MGPGPVSYRSYYLNSKGWNPHSQKQLPLTALIKAIHCSNDLDQCFSDLHYSKIYTFI